MQPDGIREIANWVRVIQADDDQIATTPFVEAGQD